jgi:amino acid adenylation domain-containing protein
MEYLLQHLLAKAAREFPDKTAVICGGESVTYRELDELADKLAATLLENGMRRGDRVGIYMNKSVASVISIHGILKTGAIYVPLDPNAPPARLAYIIQNCGIRCLVASTRKARAIGAMFPEGNPLQLVVLTDNSEFVPAGLTVKAIRWSDVTDRKPTAATTNLSIETDLAYILYTSGSTGVPKGVMISHLNSLTFVNWAHDTIEVNSEDRVSNHAPLHFDLSIFDIFATIKAGATLVIVPDGLSPFPIRLAQWIEEQRISIWYSVPSVLSMMVLYGELERRQFSTLRTIVFAGEVFPVKYLRKLMKLIPHADYYNLYGPTETNVITWYKVPRIASRQVKPIPIGKACANTEVFALTEDGQIVTRPGQTGELFARGSSVAQGYWGDVEKTKGSIIPNPLQPNFRENIYNTGDLVTLDQEGNYLFLGRRDHMIKSRGYRIELGEIETVLYNHPQVKEAVVVAVPDDVVGNRIKAFVVLSDNHVGSAELQGFCLKRIPKYMVPETIELRKELPKTSTGKIDRSTLMKQV